MSLDQHKPATDIPCVVDVDAHAQSESAVLVPVGLLHLYTMNGSIGAPLARLELL